MKVYIATIAWRSLHPSHVFCLIDALTTPGIIWGPIAGDALVERSRGRAATDFLRRRPEADVLLSIDTDIIFRPQDVRAVCEQALGRQAVVAGVYMTRGRGGHPTSKLELDRRYDFHITDDPSSIAPEPIVYAAGGFMAVPRSIFETLARDLPLCDEDTYLEQYPFYQPFVSTLEDGRPTQLSEDWAFCERARRAGFPILANTGVRLGHVGEQTFWPEEMLRADVDPQPFSATRRADGYHIDHVREEVAA